MLAIAQMGAVINYNIIGASLRFRAWVTYMVCN